MNDSHAPVINKEEQSTGSPTPIAFPRSESDEPSTASAEIAQEFLLNALRFSGFNDTQREHFRVRDSIILPMTMYLFP
jgi:hypothetical protein